MLFATSLAEKLGPKGLIAVSPHPSAIATNLGIYLDWNVQYSGPRKLESLLCSKKGATQTTGQRKEDVDKKLGNKEGFTEGIDFKTPARGVATYVYAMFEPRLKGYSFPLHISLIPLV